MITLNDTLDITADVEPRYTDSAAYSDIFGMIAPKREYVLKDPNGRYNPFSPTGYLNRNPWRAMSIRETDDNGAILFDGQIYDVQPRDDGRKRSIILSCRDPLGVKLDWPVNMCDLATYAGWEVDTFTAATETEVPMAAISGSPADIVVGAIVSFNDDYSPSYEVTAVDTGTDTITLDRGLAEPLDPGTVVNVAVPTVETAPAAIQRALDSAGIESRTDSTFDVIDLSDSANSRFLWFFIQPANKVKLRDFIEQVAELGDLYLSVSKNGVISCRRGLRYDGQSNLKAITPSEMIAPMTGPYYDMSRLIYAYDVLYTAPSSVVTIDGRVVAFEGDAKLVSNQVDSTTLDEFAATDVWRPVSPSSSDIRDYTILYANESTARYFGERRLSYYGVGRPRIRVGLKRAVSGQPNNRYSLALFDEISVTYPVAPGQTVDDVHGVIMGYNYDAQNRRFAEIEIELTGLAEAQYTETALPDYVLTEGGEEILTETGDYVIAE